LDKFDIKLKEINFLELYEKIPGSRSMKSAIPKKSDEFIRYN
jgi:hypothetical protein